MGFLAHIILLLPRDWRDLESGLIHLEFSIPLRNENESEDRRGPHRAYAFSLQGLEVRLQGQWINIFFVFYVILASRPNQYKLQIGYDPALEFVCFYPYSSRACMEFGITIRRHVHTSP